MPQLWPVTPRRPHPSWPTTKSPQFLLFSFPRLTFAWNSAAKTSDANGDHAQAKIKRTQPNRNTQFMAGEDFGGGKRARRKGLLRTGQHSASRTSHWTAAFLRAKFKYFVPSRSQKVILAGKAQERPSHFSEDLSLCLLRRAWLWRSAGSDPAGGTNSSPPKKAPVEGPFSKVLLLSHHNTHLPFPETWQKTSPEMPVSPHCLQRERPATSLDLVSHLEVTAERWDEF